MSRFSVPATDSDGCHLTAVYMSEQTFAVKHAASAQRKRDLLDLQDCSTCLERMIVDHLSIGKELTGGYPATNAFAGT